MTNLLQATRSVCRNQIHRLVWGRQEACALGLSFPLLSVAGIHSPLRLSFGFPEANPEISLCVQGVPVGRRPGQVCKGDPEAKAGQDFWAGFGNLFGF